MQSLFIIFYSAFSSTIFLVVDFYNFLCFHAYLQAVFPIKGDHTESTWNSELMQSLSQSFYSFVLEYASLVICLVYLYNLFISHIVLLI